jgi:hypothetical protein
VRNVRPLVAGALLLLASLSILGYLVRSPFEITRLRNSLLADVGIAEDFGWSPESPPADYAAENEPAPAEFQQIVQALRFDASDETELDRALAIARHLTNGDVTTGEAIQSNTLSAYKAITERNRGYCADYTQVFNALNLASGVPVREWGMSFDGFSGDGHAFSEIYDSQLGKWVFIDSFYSFYVVDPITKVPLSVLELRERLKADRETLRAGLVPIDPAAFAFREPRRAIDYYGRGLEQFYLWFGNDVFSYDGNPVVAAAAGFGRPAEQAVAIMIGAHPKIRIVPDAQGVQQITRTFWLFWTAFALGVLACGVLSYAFFSRRAAAQKP